MSHEMGKDLKTVEESSSKVLSKTNSVQRIRKAVKLDQAKTTKTLPMRENSVASLYREPSLDKIIRRPMIETSINQFYDPEIRTKECYTTVQPHIEEPLFCFQKSTMTKSP